MSQLTYDELKAEYTDAMKMCMRQALNLGPLYEALETIASGHCVRPDYVAQKALDAARAATAKHEHLRLTELPIDKIDRACPLLATMEAADG